MEYLAPGVLIFKSKLSYSYRERLMGINSKIAAAAMLSLVITGCTIGEDTSTPPNNTSEKPPANQETETATQPFSDDLPTSSPVFAPKNPGLIESTKADVRVKGVKQGRTDPFAEIVKSPTPIASLNQKPVPIPPPLPINPITTPTRQQGRFRNIPARVFIRQPAQIRTRRQAPFIAQGRTNTNTNTNTNNVRGGATNASKPPQPPAKAPVASVIPKVVPQVVPPQKIEPVLPELPKPETAEAVYVSGVVLIGKQPKAIIKVPNEKTSRYVQAGQRLADGVLVKRIEMNGGSDPIVVFEQYGIEVAKGVGVEPEPDSSTSASVGNSVAMNTSL
ncbi:MAG: hypothetical protein F6K61_12430 [Sphaerospermopsis sp. SIO1G1]|nr:hypothetical protein [Sphaerospermopsis sp. SIO1G1]